MGSKNNPFLTLFPVLIAILMVCVEYTGITIAIPTISRSLNLSLVAIQWSTMGYLVTFAAIVVAAGQLADNYGHKKILQIGLFIFALSSFLGGMANSGLMLIIARFLQGVGAATIWPSATALAFNCMPNNKKALAIGIVTGIVGFSMALGPLFAGYFSQSLSWRWFFLINVPLSLLSIFMLYSLPITKIGTNKKERLDMFGIFFLSISLGILAVGFNLFGQNIFKTILSCTLIGVSLGCLSYFVRYERAINHAFFDANILSNKTFFLGCILRCFMNASFYMFLFIMGLYLVRVMDYDPLSSGIKFLPMTITIGVMSPIAGHIISRLGAGFMAFLGMLAFLIGYYIFSYTSSLHSTIMLIAFVLPGIGYGFLSPSLLTITMQSVLPTQSGVASGIFYMFSLISSSVGVSVATLLIKLQQHHSLTLSKEIFNSLDKAMLLCCGMLITSIIILFFMKKINFLLQSKVHR